MNKIVNTIAITSAACSLGFLSYMVMQKKKNMLDILIEEIETIK